MESGSTNQAYDAIDEPDDSSSDSASSSSQSTFEPIPQSMNKYNTMKITATTIGSIAAHSSDEKTADLLKLFQLDQQQSNCATKFNFFNHKKINYWKHLIRKVFLQRNIQQLQSQPIISILYDSKLENQISYQRNDRGTLSRTNERENHFSIIVQPANEFATSVSIKKSSKKV